MDVLRHITDNQDFSFTKNIKVSSFLEGSQTHEALPQAPQQEKKVEPRVRGGFKTMVLCILSEYDPMYQGLNPNERALYLRQRCLEISGSLDVFARNLIQHMHISRGFLDGSKGSRREEL